MTQAQARAKEILNSLTDLQKNHIQQIFNDGKFCERIGNKKDADKASSEIFTLINFLTAGEGADVYSVFGELLYDYNIKRYNQEQKHIDDMMLND